MIFIEEKNIKKGYLKAFHAFWQSCYENNEELYLEKKVIH